MEDIRRSITYRQRKLNGRSLINELMDSQNPNTAIIRRSGKVKLVGAR